MMTRIVSAYDYSAVGQSWIPSILVLSRSLLTRRARKIGNTTRSKHSGVSELETQLVILIPSS